MQNYEDLYNTLQPMEKALKDSAAAVTRLQKAIQKNTDSGNLTEVRKSLEALTGKYGQQKDPDEISQELRRDFCLPSGKRVAVTHRHIILTIGLGSHDIDIFFGKCTTRAKNVMIH